MTCTSAFSGQDSDWTAARKALADAYDAIRQARLDTISRHWYERDEAAFAAAVTTFVCFVATSGAMLLVELVVGPLLTYAFVRNSASWERRLAQTLESPFTDTELQVIASLPLSAKTPGYEAWETASADHLLGLADLNTLIRAIYDHQDAEHKRHVLQHQNRSMTIDEDEWKRKFEFELSVNAFGDMRRLLRKKGGEVLSDIKNVNMLEAAMWGRKSRLERIIAEGADPNAFNTRALENAAFAGRTECVRVLLDHGADARANESLAVCFAAIRGDADIVRMLVEHGADPKTRNHSALPDAIGSGNDDCVRLLLEYGLDPRKQEENIRWKMGRIAKQAKISHGGPIARFTRWLKRKIGIPCPAAYRITPQNGVPPYIKYAPPSFWESRACQVERIQG